MALFERRSTKEKKNHLRNLVQIANADGHLHPKEKNLYILIGLKLDLPESDIDEILSNPGKPKNISPKDIDEKFRQLIDLTSMIIIDGNITDEERECCRQIADRMGLPSEKIREIVDRTISMVKRNKSEDVVIRGLKSIIDRSW